MNPNPNYRRRRIGLAAGIVALIAIGATAGKLATAEPSSPPARTPAPSANAALDYPTQIAIPDELARAVGAARAQQRCATGEPYSYAEVDEAGTVADVVSSCTDPARPASVEIGTAIAITDTSTTMPLAHITTHNVPDGKCHEDDPATYAPCAGRRVVSMPETR